VIGRGVLVSVRDAGEATEALAGGGAIIDVKEPSAGPLGAADPATIAAIAAVVGTSVPWTLACGELIEGDRDTNQGEDRVVDFARDVALRLEDRRLPLPPLVKVGLSGLSATGWRGTLERLAARLPMGTGLVAVAYADWQHCGAPQPEEVFAAAPLTGCRGILVDTFAKAGPGLFGLVDGETVGRWVKGAHAGGLPIALAGKLGAAEAALALSLGADVVGVRSAACVAGGGAATDGDRRGRVCRQRVRSVVEQCAAVSRGESA
jgi:hypothetical protein